MALGIALVMIGVAEPGALKGKIELALTKVLCACAEQGQYGNRSDQTAESYRNAFYLRSFLHDRSSFLFYVIYL